MRRVIFTLIACAGLLGVGLTPASAASPVPPADTYAAPVLVADTWTAPVRITNAQYLAVTQDVTAACATLQPNGDMKPPTAPDAVDSAALLDRVDAYGYLNSKYTRSIGAWLTGNGLPTVWWRANKSDTRDLYIPYMDMTIQVQHTAYMYHAWVPAFRGASCSTWTEIEYVD